MLHITSAQAKSELSAPAPHQERGVGHNALQLRFITTTEPKQSRDASTRKLVRSHVVKNYHATRHLALNRKERPLQAKLASLSDCICSTKQDVPDGRTGRPPGQRTTCSNCGGQQMTQISSEHVRLQVVEPFVRQLHHNQPRHSPVTLLGAGTSDPFMSYPVHTTPRVNILVDHCKFGFYQPLCH